MADKIRSMENLARNLRSRREFVEMGKTEPAAEAGKVREVVYRLEAGEGTTVSSLLAVLGALGLVMRLDRAGLLSAQEVARRFQEDDDDA